MGGVDESARTISGLVVPWDNAARVNGADFPVRFVRGSILVDSGARLLGYHDRARPLGAPTTWQDTPNGLRATFKVARTRDGDEALSMAADGILDGLSIGAELVDIDEIAGEIVVSKRARPRGFTRNPAGVGECPRWLLNGRNYNKMHTRPRSSITAESLRPEQVDDEGRPVITGDAPPEPAPAPAAAPRTRPRPRAGPAPAPPTAAGAAPAPAPNPDPPAPVAAGITTAEILAALGVDPDRRPMMHSVREPSPYLEAGGRISERFGFFTDLYAAGARGDGEAGRRAAQFQSQLRDYIAAANSTTDSTQIVPPAWGASGTSTR